MKSQNVLNKKKKKKGFTLIELIIVIAIIAILAVIAIPKFGEVRKNANASSDLANGKVIANSVNALIADGELDLPSSGDKTLVIKSTATGDAKKVVDYIQTEPSPEYASNATFFIVTLSSTGTVVVKDNCGNQSYPCKDLATYKSTATSNTVATS